MRLRGAGLEFLQRSFVFRQFGCIPGSLVKAGWFDLCTSYGLLSAADHPIFTTSPSLEADEGVCLIYRKQSAEKLLLLLFSQISTYRPGLYVETGLGHCFCLQVFFLQADDLLLVVDASQVDPART